MNFSVLISIYHKERPEYFHRAMQSIWDEQTHKPDEIVLVLDGPLNEILDHAIDMWKVKLNEVLTIVPLEKNIGLGEALNIGLAHCRYDIVARMDTDDMAMPHRFALQRQMFESEEIDICGSWISEFDTDEAVTVSIRKVPANHDEITRFAKYRNPLNHPSVMYRKSVVELAGNYRDMAGFEDYYLWVRILMHGGRFVNIQEPLVHMRAGYGQLERRSGREYARNEYVFLRTLRTSGFLSGYEWVRNVMLRIPARVIPNRLLKTIYKQLREMSKH